MIIQADVVNWLSTFNNENSLLNKSQKTQNECKFDLIIADPPYYKLNNEWDKKQFNDFREYLEWMNTWITLSITTLKDTGSIFIFCDWMYSPEITILMKNMNLKFRNNICWERNKGRGSKSNFKSVREDILYFTKTNKFIFNEQKKIRPVIAPYKNEDGTPKGWFVDEEGNRVRWTGVGNVWHYTPPNWSSKLDKQIHPTQKPVALIQRIIEATTNEKDLVLDLFSGSGSTAVACKLLNRNCTSIEYNKIYIDKIHERLESL